MEVVSRWVGVRALLGFLGGETNQWYSDLVDDNHTIPPRRRPRRAITLQGSDRQGDRVHPRSKAVAPDKPWYMFFSRAAARAAPRSPRSGRTATRGLRRGLEAIRATILEDEKGLGCFPTTPSFADQPHGEPDVTGPADQPWPQLDFVRPGLLWEREAIVRAYGRVVRGFVSYTDDQIARLIDYLDESGQLDNTIIMVVSDNGSSGEGGRTARSTRTSLQQRHRQSRRNLERLDDLDSRPVQPLQHRLGVGLRHPFPSGSASPATRVAWWTSCSSHGRKASTRTRRPRPYVHAVDLVPTIYACSASSRQRCSRVTRRARSRARALHPHSPTRPRPGARPSSTRCSECARSITTAGSRTRCTRDSGWGKFHLDEWELYNLADDRSQITTLPPSIPSSSRN